MSAIFHINRRSFLTAAGTSLLTGPLFMLEPKAAPARLASLGNIKQIKAGVLDIGYAEMGPVKGTPVILLHGWPYDIHSYIDVAPILAAKGCRVIIPHLRGHGTTTFLDQHTQRSGQQAALGADLIALMDALEMNQAVFAGYDWGGRAACVAAALWPHRCRGLVSVNGYLIQNIAGAATPLSAANEAAFWYQFYFLTDRGRRGLTINKKEIIELMWARNSPQWHFSPEVFKRSLPAFENPDYIDIVIHSYRHRLGFATGAPEYQQLEARLAAQPTITVPSITLDGDSDGVVAATDGKSSASRFTDRQHRIVKGAGHNLPQENPGAFAAAVWELATKKQL